MGRRTYFSLFSWLVILMLKSDAFSFIRTSEISRVYESGNLNIFWTIDESLANKSGKVIHVPSQDVIAEFSDETLQNVMPGYNVTIIDDTITVSKMNVSDDMAGSYNCSVSSEANVVIWNNEPVAYIIKFPTKPKLHLIPAAVIEGNRTLLRCESTSQSVPTKYQQNLTYTFYKKDGLPIYPNVQSSEQYSNSTYKGDNGTEFSCAASDEGLLSQESNSKILIVQWVPIQPTLSVSPPDVPIFVGEQHQLICNSTDVGNPPNSTYKFNINGIEHNGYNKNSYTYNTSTSYTATCSMENSIGISKTSNNLTVEAHKQPTVQLTPNNNPVIVVSDDDDYFLSCTFICQPTWNCQVTWTQNDSTNFPAVDQNKTETMLVTKLRWKPDSSVTERKQSAGQYTCIGSLRHSNKTFVETIMLVVHYPPQIRDFDINMTPDEGSTIIANCSVDSLPEATISIYNGSKNQFIATGKNNAISHEIHDVGCNDWDIECRADNNVTRNKSSISKLRISGQCKPRIGHTNVSDNMVSIIPGGSVIAQFVLVANPAVSVDDQINLKYTSSLTGEVSSPGLNVRSNVIIDNVIELAIIHSSEENLGNYTMTMNNINGQGTYSFTLVFEAVRDGTTVSTGAVVAACICGSLLLATLLVLTVVLLRTYPPACLHQENSGSNRTMLTLVERVRAIFKKKSRRRSSTTSDGVSFSNQSSRDTIQNSYGDTAEAAVHFTSIQDESSSSVANQDPASKAQYVNVGYAATSLDVPYANTGLSKPKPEAPYQNLRPALLPKVVKDTSYASLKPTSPSRTLRNVSPQQLRLGGTISRKAAYHIQNCQWNTQGRKIDVVLKKTTKGANAIYKDYLKTQAEVFHLLEQRQIQNVVRMAGFCQEKGLVIFEKAEHGSLQEYLPTVALYVNDKASVKKKLGNFVHQVVSAFAYIHRSPGAVFHYSLSADHVLMFTNDVCKLTGFASPQSVRARERWERDNGLPRPLRWLAPEAIDLKHEEKSDIWGLALLIWQVFSEGEIPFPKVEDGAIYDHISCGAHLSRPEFCDMNLYEELRKCLYAEPKQRPEIGSIFAVCPEPRLYQNV